MEKKNAANTFVDPMDQLFAQPPNRTRWETFRIFLYNSETGAFLGRTPCNWAQLTVFYIIFFSCLAAMFAVCMWGLLQSLSDDRPSYQLDESIIGSSPGLASRPIPPEGRDSILSFDLTNKTWHNTGWPTLLGDFLHEYENSSTGHPCNFTSQQLPCEVDTKLWGECEPNGNQLNAACLYFKINKILEWLPTYYRDANRLPSEMPQSLKQVIQATSSNQVPTEMVWLSCEGRHNVDKEKLGTIKYYPRQGFPGYYFPFRRQTHYKSPVVAVHFENPQKNENIDVECRSWAPNIHQDRKEQLAVLNFKLRFSE